MAGLFVQRAGDSVALGVLETVINTSLPSYIPNLDMEEVGSVLSVKLGSLIKARVISVTNCWSSCFSVIH